MNPVWQDMLHQATQTLLAQRSLSELMRALHGLSFSVIRFDRVNILRLDPLHNRITHYGYDPESKQMRCSNDVLLAEGPGGKVWPISSLFVADAMYLFSNFHRCLNSLSTVI